MIVECSECQTRFQLDDSRVPASGIRVRCSRCKHAFFLKPPGADPDEALHEVAEEAARSPAAPGSTQDLERVQAAGAGSESEDDEAGDWEFNADVPEPAGEDDSGPAPSAAEESPLRVAGIDDEDEGQEFGEDDLKSEDLSAAEEPFESAPATGHKPEPVEMPTPGPDTPVGRLGAGERDESAFGSVEEIGDLGAGTSADATGEGGDDLEDWDFFGDAETTASAIDELSSGGGRGAAASDESGAREAGAPTGLDSLADSVRRESTLMPWIQGAGHFVGWVAVLGLLGLGFARGLWPGWASSETGARVARVGGFQVASVEAHWIDSARLGRLLVVTGELRSPPAGHAAPLGPLQLTLLDDSGRPLEHPGVPIGLPLSEGVLRESGRPAFSASRRDAVDRLSSLRVAPGASVHFQGVVDAVPIEAVRFDIRPSGAEPVGESESVAESVGSSAGAAPGSSEDGVAEADAEGGSAPTTGTPPPR